MQISSFQQACEFMLAGNATLTFVSKRTGTRYTYKVRKPEKDSPHFVKVLIGSNNESDYMFIGTIFDGKTFRPGRNSNPEAKNIKAFSWVWKRLIAGQFPCEVEIYHEGRCGCCGRKLTTPESITSGFGPKCRKD